MKIFQEQKFINLGMVIRNSTHIHKAHKYSQKVHISTDDWREYLFHLYDLFLYILIV